MHSTVRHLRSNPRPLQFAEGLPPSVREPGSRKRSKAKVAESSLAIQTTPSHNPRGARAPRTVHWNLTPTVHLLYGADQIITAHEQEEAIREQRLVDEQLAHEYDQVQRPVSNYLFRQELQRKDRDRSRQAREQRRFREEQESLLRPRMHVLDQACPKSFWGTLSIRICKYVAAVGTILIMYLLFWVWITDEAFRIRLNEVKICNLSELIVSTNSSVPTMYELLGLNCTLRNALSPRCGLGSGESTQETILRALNSTLSIEQACPASIEAFVFYHLNTTEARDRCGALMETQMQAASLLLNDEIRKVYNENFMPQMQFVDSVARLDALNSRCSWPRADLRKKLDDIGKHL